MRAGRRAHPRHQLRPGSRQGRARAVARGDRRRRRHRVRPPPTTRGEPAVRPRRRRPPDVLGGGAGRDHRVRLAHGRDVHRPAVPAERARVLDRRFGRGDPSGRDLHGARRAAVGQDRRGARRAFHVAVRLRVRDARLPHDAAAVGREHRLLGGRARATGFVGIGVGLAGTPASHSLTGSVPVRRVGMASGTADLQRDLGGAIMQSIFGALLTAGYASAAQQPRSVARSTATCSPS